MFESEYFHDKGIQVRFENGDLWLTQKAMSELYRITLKKYLLLEDAIPVF